MGIEIYTLTPLGHRLARSTRSPDNPNWRVVHYLDQVGHSTKDQIAAYCGMGESEVSAVVGRLRRKKIINEMTGATV